MIARIDPLILVLIILPFTGAAGGQEQEAPTPKSPNKGVKMASVTLASGEVSVSVPETWKQSPPRSGIVEREFTVPPVEGDEAPGRLTMMPSGGSVDANIERWFAQFKQADEKATKDVAKVTKKKINGQDAVIVDVSGTFQDRQGGGPFAPGKLVEHEAYRLLGGIVQTKTKGKPQYFFKLTGPQKTIAAAEKHFQQMMESVSSK